jgi:hypothetical protein
MDRGKWILFQSFRLVGAVGIENNNVRNFKDLRGMPSTLSHCKGILIAPSKLLAFRQS